MKKMIVKKDRTPLGSVLTGIRNTLLAHAAVFQADPASSLSTIVCEAPHGKCQEKSAVKKWTNPNIQKRQQAALGSAGGLGSNLLVA